MEVRAKHFIIAVSLTILDALVVVHYGGVIWRAWSGIIWSRMTLLLLAALWTTTLLDLWTRAYYDLRYTVRARGLRLSPGLVTTPTELRGERDV
jgi:hypothetical protein